MAASIYKKRTDSELVDLCLGGDALAWEALIMRYRRFIYSIPVKFGFKGADAADIFQSVCVKLLEHLHEVKDESKINAWLSTTTTRQCLSAIANRHRETPTADEEFEEPLDPSMNLEEIQVLAEAQQDIRDCIENLPPRCRDLIDMLYFDLRSLSYQEISESLGIPVASIGPNRARCLERLKKILQQRGIK